MKLCALLTLFFFFSLILPAGMRNPCCAQATPPFSLSAAIVPANCGEADGAITVTAINGIPAYTYSIDNINWQASNQFTGLAPGNYTIWCLQGNGVKVSIAVVVNNTCLALTATAVNSSCGLNNGSIQALATSGTPAYQYSLDGVHYQSSNSFTGLAPGDYTVTVKDANGRTGVVDVTVGNLPGPTIANTAVTAVSCAGANGTATITLTGGTAPFVYSLDGVHFQTSNLFTGLAAGTFQATVEDDNGCLATAPVTIPLNNTLTVDAGNDQTICQGSGTDLNGQTNGSVVSWQPSTGLSNTNSLHPIARPGVTTQYYLEVSSGVCHAIDSVTIIVNPAPIANAGPNDTVCYGANAQLNGSGGLLYTWSPANFLSNVYAPDPVVSQPTATTTYSLSVSDANHCGSLNYAAITVTVTPPKALSVGNDTSIAIGEPLQLDAVDVDSSGFTQYQWSPATGLNNPGIADPIANLSENITYTVTATTAGGCLGMAVVGVKVYQHADIYVPNAFTPNGDGHNDVFRAIAVGIKTFNYLVVFNRWGVEVFHSSDPEVGWNGQYGGVLQTTGTYVWMVSGVDYEGRPVQHKGTVILVR
jgi:gliding motility-associated-like protein